MPVEESTPAIVLRARDYADSDRIVTLLTRNAGKLSGIADGLGTLARGIADSALRQAFEMRLLGWAGFGLEFGRCRLCSTISGDDGAAVYFVISRGGVVCARCRPSVAEGAIKLAGRSAAILARLSTLPMTNSPGSESAGPDGALALSRFIGSISPRRLRTAA